MSTRSKPRRRSIASIFDEVLENNVIPTDIDTQPFDAPPPRAKTPNSQANLGGVGKTLAELSRPPSHSTTPPLRVTKNVDKSQRRKSNAAILDEFLPPERPQLESPPHCDNRLPTGFLPHNPHHRGNLPLSGSGTTGTASLVKPGHGTTGTASLVKPGHGTTGAASLVKPGLGASSRTQLAPLSGVVFGADLPPAPDAPQAAPVHSGRNDAAKPTKRRSVVGVATESSSMGIRPELMNSVLQARPTTTQAEVHGRRSSLTGSRYAPPTASRELRSLTPSSLRPVPSNKNSLDVLRPLGRPVTANNALGETFPMDSKTSSILSAGAGRHGPIKALPSNVTAKSQNVLTSTATDAPAPAGRLQPLGGAPQPSKNSFDVSTTLRPLPTSSFAMPPLQSTHSATTTTTTTPTTPTTTTPTTATPTTAEATAATKTTAEAMADTTATAAEAATTTPTTASATSAAPPHQSGHSSTSTASVTHNNGELPRPGRPGSHDLDTGQPQAGEVTVGHALATQSAIEAGYVGGESDQTKRTRRGGGMSHLVDADEAAVGADQLGRGGKDTATVAQQNGFLDAQGSGAGNGSHSHHVGMPDSSGHSDAENGYEEQDTGRDRHGKSGAADCSPQSDQSSSHRANAEGNGYDAARGSPQQDPGLAEQLSHREDAEGDNLEAEVNGYPQQNTGLADQPSHSVNDFDAEADGSLGEDHDGFDVDGAEEGGSPNTSRVASKTHNPLFFFPPLPQVYADLVQVEEDIASHRKLNSSCGTWGSSSQLRPLDGLLPLRIPGGAMKLRSSTPVLNTRRERVRMKEMAEQLQKEKEAKQAPKAMKAADDFVAENLYDDAMELLTDVAARLRKLALHEEASAIHSKLLAIRRQREEYEEEVEKNSLRELVLYAGEVLQQAQAQVGVGKLDDAHTSFLEAALQYDLGKDYIAATRACFELLDALWHHASTTMKSASPLDAAGLFEQAVPKTRTVRQTCSSGLAVCRSAAQYISKAQKQTSELRSVRGSHTQVQKMTKVISVLSEQLDKLTADLTHTQKDAESLQEDLHTKLQERSAGRAKQIAHNGRELLQNKQYLLAYLALKEAAEFYALAQDTMAADTCTRGSIDAQKAHHQEAALELLQEVRKLHSANDSIVFTLLRLPALNNAVVEAKGVAIQGRMRRRTSLVDPTEELDMASLHALAQRRTALTVKIQKDYCEFLISATKSPDLLMFFRLDAGVLAAVSTIVSQLDPIVASVYSMQDNRRVKTTVASRHSVLSWRLTFFQVLLDVLSFLRATTSLLTRTMDLEHWGQLQHVSTAVIDRFQLTDPSSVKAVSPNPVEAEQAAPARRRGSVSRSALDAFEASSSTTASRQRRRSITEANPIDGDPKSLPNCKMEEELLEASTKLEAAREQWSKVAKTLDEATLQSCRIFSSYVQDAVDLENALRSFWSFEYLLLKARNRSARLCRDFETSIESVPPASTGASANEARLERARSLFENGTQLCDEGKFSEAQDAFSTMEHVLGLCDESESKWKAELRDHVLAFEKFVETDVSLVMKTLEDAFQKLVKVAGSHVNADACWEEVHLALQSAGSGLTVDAVRVTMESTILQLVTANLFSSAMLVTGDTLDWFIGEAEWLAGATCNPASPSPQHSSGPAEARVVADEVVANVQAALSTCDKEQRGFVAAAVVASAREQLGLSSHVVDTEGARLRQNPAVQPKLQKTLTRCDAYVGARHLEAASAFLEQCTQAVPSDDSVLELYSSTLSCCCEALSATKLRCPTLADTAKSIIDETYMLWVLNRCSQVLDLINQEGDVSVICNNEKNIAVRKLLEPFENPMGEVFENSMESYINGLWPAKTAITVFHKIRRDSAMAVKEFQEKRVLLAEQRLKQSASFSETFSAARLAYFSPNDGKTEAYWLRLQAVHAYSENIDEVLEMLEQGDRLCATKFPRACALLYSVAVEAAHGHVGLDAMLASENERLLRAGTLYEKALRLLEFPDYVFSDVAAAVRLAIEPSMEAVGDG